MKAIFPLTVFLFLFAPARLSAQETLTTQQKVDELRSHKLALEQQIQLIQDSIEQIEQYDNGQLSEETPSNEYVTINAVIGDGILMKTDRKLILRSESSKDSRIVTTIPGRREIKILGMEKYPFYRVQYNDQVGYVCSNDIDPTVLSIKGLLKPENEIAYHLAHPNSAAPSSSYDSAPRSSGSKIIYTGPRGGRYHRSASGKKVYEKKKH